MGLLPRGVRSATRPEARKAAIAITLDLEMSRNFPTADQTHWDFEKGNLDSATKQYALEAARHVHARGGRIHFFAVGRVFEQDDIAWLKEIAAMGHPIGNHTYDHVNLQATKPEEIQFRFRRAPWLIAGKSVPEVLADNIRLATEAMKSRLGLEPAGFRTPGGFRGALRERPDLQALLQAQGFSWVSSWYPVHPYAAAAGQPAEETFREIVAATASAQPFRYPNGLVEVPMSPISDVGAFRNAQWTLADFLTSIERCVAWAIRERAMFDFLAHPSVLVVKDPEFRAVERICDRVNAARDQAEIVDLGTIAGRVAG